MQHILENNRPQALQCRSIVACARLFSNCHVATEGGIPRSSRWVVRFSPPRSSVSTDRQRFSAFPNFDFVSHVCTQLNALQASGRRSSSPSCGKDSCSSAIRAKSQARLREPVARCRANSLRHLNPIFQKKYLKNQWLDRLCRFGVRVNCATHDGKPSIGRAPTQFLYCVCRSLR